MAQAFFLYLNLKTKKALQKAHLVIPPHVAPHASFTNTDFALCLSTFIISPLYHDRFVVLLL